MDNNWSIETIQQRAANNWSLEGDNQLLNLIKSISQNLEQRCVTSNNNLNRLMLDVDKTKIKLGNATTKLLDLNNSKFVEHTVADIDTFVPNSEKCSTVENDKAFIPLPKAVEEAVTNGLSMMDRCYEKMLLTLEDSDEDENEKEEKHVVCRPKNPYLDRPLPYLIGSKQWNDKWHIGLIESDEEVMSDEEKEEFSQSSSEDGDSLSISPETSNPATTSESDFVAPKTSINHREDLFHGLSDEAENKTPLLVSGNTERQERIKVLPTIVPSTQKEPETQSIMRSQLTEPSVPSSTEQPKQTIFARQKPEQKFLNLFDDEPPLLDAPLKNERKAPNLFLDSDDDDMFTQTSKPSSIFNNNITKGPSFQVSTPPMDNTPVERKSKSSSNGDMDNNNIPVMSKTETKPKPTPKSNDFGELFDDEPPDDFFDIIIGEKNGTVSNNKTEKSKVHTKTANLFGSDDDDDDDDFSRIIGTTRKTEPKTMVNEKETTSKIMPEKSNVSYSPFNSPYRSLQNTGPPKSYVSFLDDDTEKFDDFEEEIKSPPLPDIKKSSSNDSEVKPETSTRRSSSKIIYDDIAEAIPKDMPPPPTVTSSNHPSGSLKDNSISRPVIKPRPKIAHDNKTVSSESKDPSTETLSRDDLTRDETDQSLTFKKNLSLFSNPEIQAVEKEIKPKPNKLKTNFNINVAALLPGAKLPSQKQITIEKSDRIEEPQPEHTENVSEETITQSISSIRNTANNVEDSSGRLPCLGKDRAKIQVRRKPSTRSGRKNLLAKSLMEENQEVITSNETTDLVYNVNEPSEQVTDSTANETIPKTDVTDSDWFSSSSSHDEPPAMESQNVIGDDEEEDWLKNIDEKPPSPSKTNLYEDDDWLTAKVVSDDSKAKTSNVSHVMNFDWLTASNLPPEDINPPSHSIDDDHEHDDWLSSYVTKEKVSIVADLPNDDYDWLFSAEVQQSPKVVATTKDVEVEREIQKKKEVEKEQELEKKKKEKELEKEKKLEKELEKQKQKELEKEKELKRQKEKEKELDKQKEKELKRQKEKEKELDKQKEKELERRKEKEKELDKQKEKELQRQKDNELQKQLQKEKEKASEQEIEKENDDWFLKTTMVPATKSKEESDDWMKPTKTNPLKVAVSEAANDGVVESSDIFASNSRTRTNLFDDDEDQSYSKSDVVAEISGRSNTETKKFDHSKLFEDEDDVPQLPPVNIVKASEQEVTKQIQPKRESSIFNPKSLQSKLFDDDDEDDDFFSSISKPKPVANQIKSNKVDAVKTTKNVSIKTKEKSLFSDDENSDSDDLFGSSKSKNVQKKKPDTIGKMKVNKPMKTGLFDDENDDDDDIFSSKTHKQRVVQADTKKKASITKPVASIPASNDPLADLLK
ncbi:WASH complex subunit 2 [Pseudolycoriella hygida]|uniref:WASH complex subunit 2 n=1 Tax=Pseudolycoriella hygida TaxID=35572 RepID=A0A9Q0S306_9DIPT|nr:WASH complex subunit 2 [Pseudolycoriella hygida]